MNISRKARVADYFSLVTFSHTIFAMPFAMIGYFLAFTQSGDHFNGMKLFYVVLCMIFARNAAMGFNRWADRKIDGQNPRTAIREIPARIIHPDSVLLFVVGNAALFVLSAKLINPLCFYLSPVALLVVLGYSFTKRFTAMAHMVLGVGLSLAPLGAYMAVSGGISQTVVCFSMAVLTWVSGFDIIYALQDEAFDREHQLHSIPARMGAQRALSCSVLLHLLTAVFVGIAGWLMSAGILYWMGTGLFLALLIYQHAIVKPGDLSRVNRAFATANGIGSVVFAVFVIADLFQLL